MSSRRFEKLLEMLTQIDVRGSDHCLKVEKSIRFRSIFGAVTSILSVVIIVVYFGSKANKLLFSNEPEVLFNREFAETYFSMDLKQRYLTFQLMINSSMIKPSELKKYIKVVGQLKIFQQKQSSSDPSIFEESSKVYPLKQVPCLQHSEGQILVDMVADSQVNKNITLNYTSCFDVDPSINSDMSPSNMNVAKGSRSKGPFHYIEYIFYKCDPVTDPGCEGLPLGINPCTLHFGGGQVEVDYSNTTDPLILRPGHIFEIELSPYYSSEAEVHYKSVDVYDYADNIGSSRKLVKSLPEIHRKQLSAKALISEVARVKIMGSNIRDVSIRNYYSFTRLMTDLGSIVETITVLVIILFKSFIGPGQKRQLFTMIHNIDKKKAGRMENTVIWSLIHKNVIHSIIKPYQKTLIKAIVLTKIANGNDTNFLESFYSKDQIRKAQIADLPNENQGRYIALNEPAPPIENKKLFSENQVEQGQLITKKQSNTESKMKINKIIPKKPEPAKVAIKKKIPQSKIQTGNKIYVHKMD